MHYGFIVTSAINTKFGVFTADERLQQTLDTIDSIYERCPDAYIALIEMSGEKITSNQKLAIQEVVDVVIDFSGTADVRAIYQNPNWDVVKSSTEIMCFQRALGILKTLNSAVDIDRWFKVSGRYLLNEDFCSNDYADTDWANSIIFATRRPSQFAPEITGGVTEQFMSRCWSFPATRISYVELMFFAMSKCFTAVAESGGYIDIEHLLFLYAEPDSLEIPLVGVQGLLGPNGTLVRD